MAPVNLMPARAGVLGSTHPGRPWPSRCPVCPLVLRVASSSSPQAHLATSARSRGRAQGPVSGRLSATISRRALIGSSRFPAAFPPPGIGFLAILFPPERSASLTVSSPPRPRRDGPRRDFHVPHAQDTTGEGALYSPGTTVLTQTDHDHRPAPVASQRPVPAPRHNPPIHAGLSFTSHQRGFKRFARPVFPSPVAPGWNSNPRAFPQAPHPAITRSARRGRDRPIEHGPETSITASAEPPTSRVYLMRAT